LNLTQKTPANNSGSSSFRSVAGPLP
jgi:hypothetical protein